MQSRAMQIPAVPAQMVVASSWSNFAVGQVDMCREGNMGSTDFGIFGGVSYAASWR